jgi:dipeptidyl aminopeptidase/acylaminoacyl peptidase
MRQRTRYAALGVGMAMLCAMPTVGSVMAQPLRPMDIRDVVEVRQVEDTQVSPDGRQAAVVVAEPSVAANKVTSRVLVLDMAAPEKVREVVSVGGAAERITNLRWRPDGRSLTYLAPHEGADEVWTVPSWGGRAQRLFAAPGSAIPVGGARALRGAVIPPHQAKVLRHEWSPTGRQLVFAVPLPPGEHTLDGVALDDKMTLEGILIGGYYPPRVGLRLWDSTTGQQRALTESEMGRATYGPGLSWSPDGSRLAVGGSSLTVLDVGSGAARTLEESWYPSRAMSWTADNSRVVVQSSGQELSGIAVDGSGRQVVGTLPEGVSRLSAIWMSPSRVVAAMSDGANEAVYAGKPGAPLARVSPENIDVSGCAFDRGRENAVCVRQTNSSAQTLAVLRADGALRAGYDPNHDVRSRAIQSPVAATWSNPKGQTATGYRIVPDGCGDGRRCPAIVITHGYDAVNKFLRQGHEWDYPSQVFAAKGYVVLLVNEPHVPGGADPQDAVSTMESAVKDAVDRGEVDPNRAGIAGYSRGAQITQRALAISMVFKAGSSGDGGDGGPGDGVGDRINAPLLAQSTEAVGVMLFPIIKRLRARGIPAEMVLFPDETHLFHQPRHREAAMRQNLDWFGKHLG